LNTSSWGIGSGLYGKSVLYLLTLTSTLVCCNFDSNDYRLIRSCSNYLYQIAWKLHFPRQKSRSNLSLHSRSIIFIYYVSTFVYLKALTKILVTSILELWLGLNLYFPALNLYLWGPLVKFSRTRPEEKKLLHFERFSERRCQ
jgi:hypothetical protein